MSFAAHIASVMNNPSQAELKTAAKKIIASLSLPIDPKIVDAKEVTAKDLCTLINMKSGETAAAPQNDKEYDNFKKASLATLQKAGIPAANHEKIIADMWKANTTTPTKRGRGRPKGSPNKPKVGSIKKSPPGAPKRKYNKTKSTLDSLSVIALKGIIEAHNRVNKDKVTITGNKQDTLQRIHDLAATDAFATFGACTDSALSDIIDTIKQNKPNKFAQSSFANKDKKVLALVEACNLA